MVPLPFDRLLDFEARLVAGWWSRSWYCRRGSLACSFGLLGLRWSEVEVVRPADLLVDGESLFVRTRKRGQPRTIGVTSRLLEAALDMRAAIAGGDDRLFVTGGGRGMVYQDVRRFVARCTTLAFGRPFSFHCFRHTAAVRVYKRTRDVVAVQRYLGHKSLQWTQSYLASLEVVDVGGPVAFAGGGEVGKPKLFRPPVEVEVKRERERDTSERSTPAIESAVVESAAASGHRCEDHAIPFRHGDGVRLRCKVCSKVLASPAEVEVKRERERETSERSTPAIEPAAIEPRMPDVVIGPATPDLAMGLAVEVEVKREREREASERSTPAIDVAAVPAEGADRSLRERETSERAMPAIDVAEISPARARVVDSVTCDHVQPWCDGDRRPLGSWRVETSGSGRRRVACRVCGRWFGDLAGVGPEAVAKRAVRKVGRQKRLF